MNKPANRGKYGKKDAPETIANALAQCPQTKDFPPPGPAGLNTLLYDAVPPNSIMSAGLGLPQQLFKIPFTNNPEPRTTVNTITRHGLENLTGNFPTRESTYEINAAMAIMTAGYSP